MEKINVTLLDKDLALSCEPEEKERLLAAVKQADDLMSQIRSNVSNMTYERIALMACIQLSKQLLSVQSSDGPFQGLAYGEVKERLDNINNLLDSAINKMK